MSPPSYNHTQELWETAFWGPVTATLDWCEVSVSTPLTCDFRTSEVVLIRPACAGKLPVQQIRCRACEYLLKCNNTWVRLLWNKPCATGAVVSKVSHRLDGMFRDFLSVVQS